MASSFSSSSTKRSAPTSAIAASASSAKRSAPMDETLQAAWKFLDKFQKTFYNRSADMKTVITAWNKLPEPCKERFRQVHGANIVSFYFPTDKKKRRFVNYYKGSFDFLWTLLQSGDEKFRREAVLKHAEDPMFLYSKFAKIDKLFKLCLPKPEDMAEFRQKFGNSEYVAMNMLDCVCYYTLGDEDELYKFIARYFPNPEDMTMFRNGMKKYDDDDSLGEIFDQAENAVKNGEVKPFKG